MERILFSGGMGGMEMDVDSEVEKAVAASEEEKRGGVIINGRLKLSVYGVGVNGRKTPATFAQHLFFGVANAYACEPEYKEEGERTVKGRRCEFGRQYVRSGGGPTGKVDFAQSPSPDVTLNSFPNISPTNIVGRAATPDSIHTTPPVRLWWW